MILDFIFAALLLYAVVTGVRRGVIVQLAELLAVLLGVYGAYKFSYLLAVWVQKLGVNASFVGVVSFVCTFILVMAAVALLGRAVHRLAQALMMGWLNRLLGAVFASLKMLFMISVALLILEGIYPLPKSQVQESKLYKPTASFAVYTFKYLDINKLKDAAKNIDEQVDAAMDT